MSKDLGWISIHRQMNNHWLWIEKREFSKAEAWIDILLNVNHSECKTVIKNKILIVKRGESIMSLDSWSKRWNWNKSKVRRFLKLLESDNMIEIKSETVTLRLTVCKYDTYQSSRNANETQTKRKRNASETHLTPNNNVNNDNNENNENKKKDVLTEFSNSLKPFLDLYGRDMLNNFYNYWTEKGDKARKYRFEKEKTWELSKRLKRWKANDFNNNNNLKSENNEQLKHLTNEIRRANPNL